MEVDAHLYKRYELFLEVRRIRCQLSALNLRSARDGVTGTPIREGKGNAAPEGTLVGVPYRLEVLRSA